MNTGIAALTELTELTREAAALGQRLQEMAESVEENIDTLAPLAGGTVEDVYRPMMSGVSKTEEDETMITAPLPISSEAIVSAAYEALGGKLTITFSNGATYRHQGVPPNVIAGFVVAASEGSYYVANIKGRY